MSLDNHFGNVITAMVTPFNENLDVDYHKAVELAHYLIESGTDTLLLAGTTGESPTLTHSEEFELFKVIKKIVNLKIPLLGICFGHQAIAQALGGHVVKSSKGWGIGIKEITTKKSNSLLGNFNKLNLIFFHQDQVVKLPQNAELIAGNSFCNISSFSIGNSVFTLQAHPEFNKDFSLKLLNARKSSIEPAKYLEAINEFETLEHDGELITPNIINFLEQKF